MHGPPARCSSSRTAPRPRPASATTRRLVARGRRRAARHQGRPLLPRRRRAAAARRARRRGPTVVVPLLLSTGYHVQTDIPAAVGGVPGRRGSPGTSVPTRCSSTHWSTGCRRGAAGPTVLLVGAGSSRPEARAELAETARLLGDRLGAPVARRRPWATTCGGARRPARAGARRDLPAGRGAVRDDAAGGRRRLGDGRARRSACTRRWSSWCGSATTRRVPATPARLRPVRRRHRAARPGSSVGTSVRLKSGRSTVRSCPWPPAAPRSAGMAPGFVRICPAPQGGDKRFASAVQVGGATVQP